MSPKAIAAGNAACGLWVRAGSWSAAQLTDGDIPSSIVSSLGGRAADARKLVEVGLWHPHTHDCDECPQPKRGHYVFHGWQEYQPTREDVERKRAEARERMAAHRGSKGVRANRSGTSRDVPRPRPDPTRNAAAAASSGGGGDLPPDLIVLRAKFRELTRLADVSWATLSPTDAAEISALIRQHGDTRLLQVAQSTYRNAAFVQAFLPTWRDLAGPRLVKADEPRCVVCNQPDRLHSTPAYADHDFVERNTA